MSTAWKILLPLLIVLPLGGYVVGSLASTTADEPPAHTPVVLREESDAPTQDPTRNGPDDGGRSPDSDRTRGRTDDEDDEGAGPVTPPPFDDDDDRGDDRGDGGDDGGDDDGDDGGDDGGDGDGDDGGDDGDD